MQKAFKKIVERLEEKIEVWRKDVTSGVKQDDGYLSLDTAKKSGRIKGLLDAQEIVNQVAEEYNRKLLNDGLISKEKAIEIISNGWSNHYSCKEMCDEINEVKSYNDGWISCSERLPKDDGFYNVTVKFWHLNKPAVISSHFECGKWTCVALDTEDEVIAWQPLPQPYVKEK